MQQLVADKETQDDVIEKLTAANFGLASEVESLHTASSSHKREFESAMADLEVSEAAQASLERERNQLDSHYRELEGEKEKVEAKLSEAVMSLKDMAAARTSLEEQYEKVRLQLKPMRGSFKRIILFETDLPQACTSQIARFSKVLKVKASLEDAISGLRDSVGASCRSLPTDA